MLAAFIVFTIINLADIGVLIFFVGHSRPRECNSEQDAFLALKKFILVEETDKWAIKSVVGVGAEYQGQTPNRWEAGQRGLPVGQDT